MWDLRGDCEDGSEEDGRVVRVAWVPAERR